MLKPGLESSVIPPPESQRLRVPESRSFLVRNRRTYVLKNTVHIVTLFIRSLFEKNISLKENLNIVENKD